MAWVGQAVQTGGLKGWNGRMLLWDNPRGQGGPTKVTPFMKMMVPAQKSTASQRWGSWIPSHCMLECWLASSWDDFVQAITVTMCSCVRWSWHVQKMLFSSCPSWPLARTVFPSPLADAAWILMEHLWLSHPFTTLRSVWYSVLTVVYCIKKLLWWALGAVLTYGLRDAKLQYGSELPTE